MRECLLRTTDYAAHTAVVVEMELLSAAWQCF